MGVPFGQRRTEAAASEIESVLRRRSNLPDTISEPSRKTMTQEEKTQPLDQEIEQILEEARMVLPGIQALFGFQLIAVFNERFDQALGDPGKRLHLAAVILTAIAIGLVMAPAAYHRQAERDRISRSFANYASFVIALAMAPLAVSLSIEVALVAFLVMRSAAVGWLVGAALMVYLAWLWYLFPVYRKRNKPGSARATRRGHE
jgi:hypothetical protein